MRQVRPGLRKCGGATVLRSCTSASGATLLATTARLPGLSDNLPAKRNIWGEPIVNEAGVGPDFLSPFRTTNKIH